MRVAHNHRPNGMGARNDNGFLTCGQCGQPVEDAAPRGVAGAGVRADDEQEVKGHKVFVFERAGSPWIEMVNDEQPLVRMTLQLLPDEARDIARALTDTADAIEGTEATRADVLGPSTDYYCRGILGIWNERLLGPQRPWTGHCTCGVWRVRCESEAEVIAACDEHRVTHNQESGSKGES